VPVAERNEASVSARAKGQMSKRSGFLLALCLLSYMLYLFNSNAVRHVISVTDRLLQKFIL
jgi:hypothetical protein